MENYLWKLSPLKAVSCVVFGETAETIIERLKLQRLSPDCESATWETYEWSADGTRFIVENGKFISVMCDSNLYYKETNLIGLSIEEVRLIVGKEDEFEEGIGEEDAAYYPEIGLTLWLNQNKIVGATCVGDN